MDETLELSIVIPCLNEAETIGTCIRKARAALDHAGIAGEIIVADNGSTDGSRDIAASLGARVIPAPARGYGSALQSGITASRGTYVVMGDADDSYDFGEAPRFLSMLREGYDLVQGCRLPAGGGTVKPGAMPFLHRWLGNPFFSLLARWWFRTRIHDIHCGMRGFRKSAYERLDLQCTGMEFASEMIVKAAFSGLRIAEAPITLHPDARTRHPPHLRTFRDGWRHLRFFLLFSPRWLFLLPGFGAIALGLLGYLIAMPRLSFGGIGFDVHTLLVASLAIICGYQAVLFAAFTKIFAIGAGLFPPDRRIIRLFEIVNLEQGLFGGALFALVGLSLIAVAVYQWIMSGFGGLDYSRTMRWVIPGVTLTALGVQTVLSSFFMSILGMRLRR